MPDDREPGPVVLRQRLAAQLLTGPPAACAAAVTGRLLAVQGQDPRGLRLALRPRSAGLSAADVDRALTVDRSLVVSWLNRGTLHLVRAQDYWWLHPLTTPQLQTASDRRLIQEQVSAAEADRAVVVIEAALAADGPLTRAQLRGRLLAAGIRTEGQALVHQLLLASIRGLIVRGPVVRDPVTGAAEQAFALVRDWLGAPPPQLDRDTALAELARRYLAGHGPASHRDLAKWAGIPLTAARRGLTAISTELASRDDGLADLRRAARRDPDAEYGQTRTAEHGAGPAAERVEGLAAGRGAAPAADRIAAGGRAAGELPPPRLLGSFDPLLHGWVSREPVLRGFQGIVTTNGIFRPFALVNGQAAATWTLSGGRVRIEPLRPLSEAEQAALAADAAAVQRYLGLA